MRTSSILTLVAAAVPAVVSAIHLAPRSDDPKVIGLDIQRRSVKDVLAHDRARLARRQNTVEQTLDNEETLYFANITLGTPAQSLRLHIDTGSSDLWVNTATSSLCSSQRNYCVGGVYSSGTSSSYKLVNNNFNISYVDGSGAVGDYVSDTLTFGGVTLENFQFGIGKSSTSSEGVLGIGYAINEVQVNRAGLAPYPNLPQALVDDGYINSVAYSLWLNDLDASTGTILFGGVNSAKYTGSLATVPVIPIYGDYYELSIALTGVTSQGKALSSSNLPLSILLDSGSTLMYLPDDIVETIYNQISAVYDSQAGAAYAYCDLMNENQSIDFTFSGKTISVPFNELFIETGYNFNNGRAACLFGIAPGGASTAVLGDTFLRSAYVVYDLGNNEISLAQTKFNATGDDIREITNGTNGVPGASAVASPVTSVVGAATGGARLGAGTGTVTAFGGTPTAAAPREHMGYMLGGAAMAGAAAVLAL